MGKTRDGRPTMKQEAFCQETLKHISPTQAAREVYNCRAKNSATCIARENMRKPIIQRRLLEIMEEQGITKERALKQFEKLMFCADKKISLQAIHMYYRLLGEYRDRLNVSLDDLPFYDKVEVVGQTEEKVDADKKE